MPETPDFDLCRTCGAWRSAHKAGLQDPLTAHDFVEPETPDFEKIAQRLIDEKWAAPWIADQLRHVWNARGAADLATMETELSAVMGETAARFSTYMTSFERAIRELDR